MVKENEMAKQKHRLGGTLSIPLKKLDHITEVDDFFFSIGIHFSGSGCGFGARDLVIDGEIEGAEWCPDTDNLPEEVERCIEAMVYEYGGEEPYLKVIDGEVVICTGLEKVGKGWKKFKAL